MSHHQPWRPITRRDALMLKVQGETVALIQFADLKQRVDYAATQLADDQAIIAGLCEKYGGRAMVEQLNNDELEAALRLITAWGLPPVALILDRST